jgi:Putative MetA-pathway of phenol degradation
MRVTMILVAGVFPVFAYGQTISAIQTVPANMIAKRPPTNPEPKEVVQMVPGIMEPSFGADRPGLSDPTDVLGVGMIQIETGFELGGSASGTLQERQSVLPQVLLRVGVLPRLELRLNTDGYSSAISNDNGTRTIKKGFADSGVSAKIMILESDIVNFTIVPSLSIPSFDENFSSGTFALMWV